MIPADQALACTGSGRFAALATAASRDSSAQDADTAELWKI
ncbi:hypothetical protein GWL_43660 [Herbaspirillum sp. GW103]|nr:hypothetical protein GWL_43660 [Herbaspirillum sp. GW103]